MAITLAPAGSTTDFFGLRWQSDQRRHRFGIGRPVDVEKAVSPLIALPSG